MKKFALSLLLAITTAAVASAEITYQADCFRVDSANPGRKKPIACDLNALVYGSSIGSVPSASVALGVTAVEKGHGFVHQTVFTLSSVLVTITDATTNGAHGGIQLYDFGGAIVTIIGASSDLTVTAGAGGIADAAVALCSAGSVVAANTNATLTSTEADFIPSTAATLSSGAGTCDGDGAAVTVFNSTSTTTDLFWNFVVPDADSSASDTVTVSGTVTVTWIESGDN